MAAPSNKTLLKMVERLRVRLGYAAQPAGTGPQGNILKDFVQSAQERAYKEINWKRLRVTAVLAPGINQTFLDYPSNINPERIIRMSASGAVTTSASGTVTMIEGIEELHRNSTKNGGNAGYDRPKRYEMTDEGIEVWPVMDVVGSTIKVEGLKPLGRLTLNNDRLTVPDDELIFNLALAAAKFHYGQKDQATYLRESAALINLAKGHKATNKRYCRFPDNARRNRAAPFNPAITDERFN